ncbi:hypothetical protein QFZ32_000621 [Streptomyces canus]|nr:hypothetical protein [Streptomyces canus]
MAAHLADTPGVAEQASLVFAFDTYIKAHGKSAHTAVEGRDPSQDAAVDQPLVTSGTWVRPGGAVLERGFAKALGVGVGDHVTVSGRDYPVVGTAISAATSVYPWSDNAQGPGTSDFGGRMWLTSADTRRASSDDPGVHLIYLKLNDPTAAQHWMATAFAGWSEADDWVNTHGWQDVLQTDKAMIRNIQPALGVGCSLSPRSSPSPHSRQHVPPGTTGVPHCSRPSAPDLPPSPPPCSRSTSRLPSWPPRSA